MDKSTILKWQTTRIAEILDSSDKNLLEIAEETGIPRTTLHRKKNGNGEFLPSEIYRLAAVTGHYPSEFYPPNYFSLPPALAMEEQGVRHE